MNQKTRPRHKKKSTAKANSSYGSLWVIIIFFLLLLGAIFYYLSDYTDFDAIKRDLIPATEADSTHLPTESGEAKPRFEFYQLLPEMTVATGVKPPQQGSAAPKAPIATHRTEYLLQVASFRQLAEADSLKARLTILGFDVDISTSQQQDITWYRVRLGPFATRPQAEDMRKALRKLQYDSLLQTRKLPV